MAIEIVDLYIDSMVDLSIVFCMFTRGYPPKKIHVIFGFSRIFPTINHPASLGYPLPQIIQVTASPPATESPPATPAAAPWGSSAAGTRRRSRAWATPATWPWRCRRRRGVCEGPGGRRGSAWCCVSLVPATVRYSNWLFIWIYIYIYCEQF